MPRPLPNRFQPDSIQVFRAAVMLRFTEAESLAATGHRTGAIYLLGYSVEMILKAAYFSLVGFAPRQTISLLDLRGAALSASFPWPGPNLHHLSNWAHLLVERRATMPHGAYPVPGFSSDIVRLSGQLYRVWRESMRYHKNLAYPYEIAQAREAAHWFSVHSLAL